MKKNKEKITSNDVLDALSIRVNDLLKTTRVGTTDKKNSAYFWLFKLLLLMLYLWIICILFRATRELGVSLIYFFGKSLRSILSIGWVTITSLAEGIIVLYIVYQNACVFTESAFYKKLYHTDKPMKEKKDKVFNFIKGALQGVSIVFLVIIGFIATLALFIGAISINFLIDGVWIISPIIICLAIFAVCYNAFKYIQNKFFGIKTSITYNSILLSIIVLIIGVGAFGYETSSYEYKNGLPLGFETIKQIEKFDVSKVKSINIVSDTKLNNIKVLVDNDLVNDIRVELEYFETANVSYIYKFNEDEKLDLEITSDLNFKVENIFDVAKLASATFNNNTIYNYNLFKYPNITVYVNEKMADKITTSHK